MVVPTAAPAPLTLAPSDATTVPTALAEAPHPGLISRQVAKHAATISRKRAMKASKRATRRILTAFPAVNKEHQRIVLLPKEQPALEPFVSSGCTSIPLLQCIPTHG
jgi:hypothetical protein